jgi:hypothetical protein
MPPACKGISPGVEDRLLLEDDAEQHSADCEQEC